MAVLTFKLKTQDRLKVWDVGSETNLGLMCCSFCQYDIDSRDHLFFCCSFARQVWLSIRSKGFMDHVDVSWEEIVSCLQPMANKHSVKSVIGPIVFAASIYFIWAERNMMMFQTSKRTPDQIVDLIVKNVRWRLLSCKFKDNIRTRKALEEWCIPLDSLMSDKEDPG